MCRTLVPCVLVALASVGGAYGETLTIEDGVPNYLNMVDDAALRAEGTPDGGISLWADGNIGAATGFGSHRMYPDVGAASGRGPRRYLTKFDVSSIPSNATVISATMSLWYQRSGSGAEAITGYKLSRLKPGKAWYEGVGLYPATDGSVTWNSQISINGAIPAIPWEVAGATGANDIDQATTIVFDKSGPGISEWKDFDIASWVQDWVSGTWENNGMVLWGGEGTGVDAYYGIVGSEDTTYASKPKLVVVYSEDELCRSDVDPIIAQSLTGYAGGLAIPFATVDMGSPDVSNGLTHISTGDGDTTEATAAGRICRSNADPADDFYMYFAVGDNLTFQGSQPAVTISFDYFDEGTGSFDLHYDGALSQWSSGPTVPLTGTNTWKRGSFTVTDAYFGNRQNYGADFRISRGAVRFYLDNVSVAVTGNHGPEVTYTIENNGTVATTWTVIEANADGTANEYAWLSLTPGTGPLPVGGSASVTAAVDTTSLGHGPQTGYVKFTDACAAPAAYNEPFTYTDGALAGQGGWTGTGETGPVLIETNQVRLNGSGASTSAHTASHAVDGGFEGVFSVKVNVKTGGALPGREGNNFWAFRAYDATGVDFGYWVGSPTTVRARNPLDANQASAVQTVGAAYKTMEMRINTGTKLTEFYYDGALVATYPFNANGAVGGITLERVANVGEVSVSEYVYLDDAQVTSVQQYRIRRINLDVIGCNYAVEPRTTSAPGFGGTVQKSFAIINTGAYNITGLTVTEIDRNSPYGNLDYDWLELTVPSPINLAPGESAEVVATINLDLVDSPEPPASLKFVASFASACAGVSGEDKLIDALTAVILVPIAYQYEMAEDVGVAQSDGVTPGMSIIASGYGDDLLADPGYNKTVAGDDCLRYARFVDTTNMSGNHGFYLDGLGTPAGVSGFTVDMRIWAEEPTAGSLGRSAALCNNQGIGRGVRIEPTLNEGNSLQLSFLSSGVIPGGGPFEIPNNLDNPSRFHMVRFVVYNDMEKIEVYDLENDLDPGEGVNWDLVARITDLGTTSGLEGLGITAGGVLLNSNSGSLTTNSKWSADWVRIVPNVALGPTDDIIPGTGETCGLFADADGDGDVDQADFAAFQVCYTGDAGGVPEGCQRFNRDGDEGGTVPSGDIDGFDRTAFENCASGPGVPFDPCCNGGPGCP